jgi:hypothetical protein
MFEMAAETRVYIHVKSSSLSDFNENGNVSTSFS